ncbi:MAG: glycosyltransferase [Planctomycetota bacterium]
MLRVLVQNRPDSAENPGGDTVQMDWTVRFLRELGHDVEVSFDLRPDLHGYDLVHLFNLTRPFQTLAQAENANRHGKPYILSSIYWDIEGAIPWHAYEFPSWLLRLLPAPVWKRLARIRRRSKGPVQKTGSESSASRDIREVQAEIVRGARIILPNSEAEKQHILDRFATARSDRIRVVLNGVSPLVTVKNKASPARRRVFLCAGAIGPRKNQLILVRAFKSLSGERLLLLGQTGAGCERYRRAVERIAGPNVEFREPVSHERMGEVLAGAKVLVQPSYIETPGLAAMEAAAAGVPIVVSDAAPVREYFGSLGHYCNPASVQSIVGACRAAALTAETPADDRGSGMAFSQRFGWARVLAPLGAIYAELAADVAATEA